MEVEFTFYNIPSVVGLIGAICSHIFEFLKSSRVQDVTSYLARHVPLPFTKVISSTALPVARPARRHADAICFRPLSAWEQIYNRTGSGADERPSGR